MKRFLAFITVLTIAFLLYFFSKMLPEFYLNLGKNDFLQKNYVSAFKDLKIAVTLSPKNRDIRYYYAKTLINLVPTLQVQKELYKISQNKLSDSADLIANQQISNWKNQILSKTGENYIERVPFNDKILRWDAKKFPINVTIQNTCTNSLPGYYINELQKAFSQWQNSTGFIKFNFVNNPQDAQILVIIIPNTQNVNCTPGECKYVVASTEPSFKGDLLQKMTITFYDSDAKKQYFSKKQIYNTAVHEIGHALGIMGHSYNKNDVMYMESNSANEPSNQDDTDFLFLSSADLNTLNLLYKLIPNITNTPLNEYDTSHQFFAPIVMGSDEQMTSGKIIEAQNYIKDAPNLPNGYVALSTAYSEQEEYTKAIETLNKALELSSTDEERFIVYYNLAINYMNIQDWENSLKHAQLAKQLNTSSSSDIDGLIEAINFNKGNKAFAKQAYIQTLGGNPGNTIDAVNLAKIYLKEFNFIDAGKTLNRLVEANPEAKNDSRVKSFALLMLFFK